MNENLKLGKQPARIDSRTLQLAKYMGTIPPTPPPHYDNTISSGITAFPMYANDRLGDCTCAAAGHMLQMWGSLLGKSDTPTEANVIALYNAVNGGKDNGAVELDVLRAWKSVGLGGEKIMAYAQIDPKNLDHVRLATWVFGGAYIGIALPIAAQTEGDWVATPELPNGGPGSWGGHAVNVVAYDETSFTCVTWGAMKRMSIPFWNAYVDEAWAIIPQEYSQGASGFDFATMQADLAIAGTITDQNPTLMPGPTPTPS